VHSPRSIRGACQATTGRCPDVIRDIRCSTVCPGPIVPASPSSTPDTDFACWRFRGENDAETVDADQEYRYWRPGTARSSGCVSPRATHWPLTMVRLGSGWNRVTSRRGQDSPVLNRRSMSTKRLLMCDTSRSPEQGSRLSAPLVNTGPILFQRSGSLPVPMVFLPMAWYAGVRGGGR
jgi:hypothetical protein